MAAAARPRSRVVTTPARILRFGPRRSDCLQRPVARIQGRSQSLTRPGGRAFGQALQEIPLPPQRPLQPR